MNPKRGPLNDPMFPEEKILTDRYLINTGTEDHHFDEELLFNNRLDGDQVHDMHCKMIMDKVNAASYVEYDGHSVIGPDTVRMWFKAELETFQLEYLFDGIDEVNGRSKSGHTYLFKKG